MKFYINGKKISKKALAEKIGKEKLDQRIQEAKKEWAEDPDLLVQWWLGGKDTMTIEHELQH